MHIVRNTQADHKIQEEIQSNIMVELDDIESMLFRLQTILFEVKGVKSILLILKNTVPG